MIPDDAAFFARWEANGVEIESGEIDAKMQRRVLDLLHYHDIHHDCSKHSVIVMEADGDAREGLVSRVFSNFRNAKNGVPQGVRIVFYSSFGKIGALYSL